MENDFNDIDLIDKYLSGDLDKREQDEFDARYSHDPDFRDEVEVYRQIYKGLQQAADEDALKETLDHYYDKYNDNRIRSIYNTRTWIITGLAASLLVAAGVIFGPKPADITSIATNHNRIPQHTKKDTGNVSDQSVAGNTRRTKPGSTDTERGNSQLPRKDTYAMISGSELPADAFREAVYPQPLSYTFHKGMLTLYGDPLMGLLLLDVYKSNNGYELLYRSQSYQLKETNDDKPQPLQSSGQQLTGEPSNEKITVQVAALQTTILHSPPFNVVLIGGPDTYYKFASDDHRHSLVVGGQFKNTECQLIELSKDNKRTWFLISGENVFEVDTAKHVKTPLRPLSGINSSVARLFGRREGVVKTVLKN